MRWLRQLACRAFWTALDGRPGPVHLNFSLREPLVLDAPLPDEEPGGGGAPAGARGSRARAALAPAPALLDGLRARARARARAASSSPAAASATRGSARRSPRSPTRGAAAARRPAVGRAPRPAAVAHYDALLRDPEAWAAAQRPDLVLRVGDLPTSKPLRQWLHGLDGALQIAFDPENAWQDPAGAVATIVAADPRVLTSPRRARTACARARRTARLGLARLAAPKASAAAAARRRPSGAGTDALSEPRVRRRARRAPARPRRRSSSPPRCRCATSRRSSRPRDDPPRVLANRGANGIDGTVSTAFGVAPPAPGPVVLLIGDVALAHDVGGLLAGAPARPALTIVLLDNDGGGIFHFLPVARRGRRRFEEHVATPHGLDFAHAAALYGLGHERVATPRRSAPRSTRARRPAPTIIEVRTDRARERRAAPRVRSRVQSVRGARLACARPCSRA